MALAMLSVAGFSAAKLMNQSNLSDQMLENIEALTSNESMSTAECHSSTGDVCWVRDKMGSGEVKFTKHQDFVKQ